MLDLKTVLVFITGFVAHVLGETCVRRYEQASSHTTDSPTYHDCTYGCCKKYGNPCCDPPFYAGTAFIITMISSLLIPVVMGVVLCLVIRSKRQQQQSRDERRRQRRERREQRERDRIFYTSGQYGPYVPGSPLSPPEYSEIDPSTTTTTTTSPQPPPPPYTSTSTASTDDTDTDDENEAGKDDSSPNTDTTPNV